MTGIATRESALAIGYCFPIIGGVLVALRFYTRWHQRSERSIDDWICVPAWLCVTGCCGSLLTGVYKNAFVDQTITDPEHVTYEQHILAQVTAALVIFWFTANALIKLAILFFYRRIFIGRIFGICSWVLITLSVIWFIYTFLSWILYCGTHLKANFEGGWAACSPWGYYIQMGVFCLDSFIDLCLLVLPIPFVWKLQLNLSRKLLVIVVFLLGGFAFVASLNNTIIQLVYLLQPDVAEGAGEGNFFQGSSLLFSNWPAIEVGVGLIACNLPSLSFRAAHALPKQIKRGWNLSWSGIRHAAAIFSLRSSSSRNRSEHNEIEATIDRHKDDPESLGAFEREHSAVSVSNIPLVHLRPDSDHGFAADSTGDATARYPLEPTANRDGKIIRGDPAILS